MHYLGAEQARLRLRRASGGSAWFRDTCSTARSCCGTLGFVAGHAFPLLHPFRVELGFALGLDLGRGFVFVASAQLNPMPTLPRSAWPTSPSPKVVPSVCS